MNTPATSPATAPERPAEPVKPVSPTSARQGGERIRPYACRRAGREAVEASDAISVRKARSRWSLFRGREVT